MYAKLKIFAMSGLDSYVDMLGKSLVNHSDDLHGHLQKTFLSVC